MSKIEEAKGLSFYLDQEAEIAEKSRDQWRPELNLFSELANLYSQLNTLSKIIDREANTPADLFLAVQSQMYGAVSQILRHRVVDAESATRRAIEAAATAYRLSRHPELLEIYANAFSKVEAEKSTNWEPSKEYKREFSTRKLFSEPAEFWGTLKTDYAMFSAMASHAGLGATAPHRTIQGKRVLHFFEGDDKNIYRCWYQQVAIYWAVLRVFLDILRRTAEPQLISIFEGEMRRWIERASTRLKERAPWIEETMRARWAKKRTGSLYSLMIVPK